RCTVNPSPAAAGQVSVLPLRLPLKNELQLVGLSPSKYSTRFEVPSPSKSPLAVWAKLPKFDCSHVSSSPSPSLSLLVTGMRNSEGASTFGLILTSSMLPPKGSASAPFHLPRPITHGALTPA